MKGIILVISVLLLGCKERDISKCLDPCFNKAEEQYTLSLFEEVDIFVPPDAESEGDQFFVYNDSILILSSERDRYSLHCFDIINKKFLRTIRVDRNFMSEPGGFYCYSLDSIYLNQNMPPATCLINESGQILQKWDLSKAPIGWSSPNPDVLEYLFAGFTYNRPILVGGNMLLVTLNDVDIWYYNNRSKHKNQGLFNLTSGKWEHVFGDYPCVFINSGNVMYPFFLSQPYLTVRENYAYVSFPVSHEVKVYDWHNGTMIKELCMAEPSLKISAPLKYNDAENDAQLRRNLIAETGYYGRLYFHNKIRLFSRLVIFQQKLRDSEGRINSPADKESAVLLFDEEGKNVGIYFFRKESPYTVTRGEIIPLGDGMLVPVKNRSSDNEFFYQGHFKFVKKTE